MGKQNITDFMEHGKVYEAIRSAFHSEESKQFQ